jgi:hypothetical protein
MAGSPTALAKLTWGSADPTTEALNFRDFDPGVERQLLDVNGTRGKFWPDSNRMLENRRIVMPRFSSEPTTPELAKILEWVMGAAPTGGGATKTYPWSNTPLAKYFHFKPVAGEEWFIDSCAADVATFSATSGGALAVDVLGCAKNYDAARSNFPTIAYDTSLQGFLLSDLVLTVGGQARNPRGFSWTVTGGIDKDRFLNSLTLTTLQRLGANQEVSFEVPSGDNGAQFWASGITGASATAVFTNATTGAVFTLDFPRLRWNGRAPVHSPGSEGFITIGARAVSVAGGEVSTVTLNPGA